MENRQVVAAHAKIKASKMTSPRKGAHRDGACNWHDVCDVQVA